MCVAKGRGREDVAAGSYGRSVGAMAIGVPRGAVFGGLVHFAVGGLIASAEKVGADELAIAGGRREVLGGDASAFPFGRDGSKAAVVEALTLRPDASIDNSDDEVGTKVRFFEEASAVCRLQAQELRRARSLHVADLFGNEREHVRVGTESLRFGWGELGGEAVKDGGVCMDDAAGSLCWRERRRSAQCGKGRLIPVLMGRENGGLGIGLHLDNVSSLLLGVVTSKKRSRRCVGSEYGGGE